MNRNEYRRAFIMLRAAEPGYSGHARLERRTLTGSLYFVVAAPEGAGALDAALVGRRGGETYAAPIGTLRRDRRGQWTLAWTFDPRDIAGRPLEGYQWIAVARADGGCAVALTGNVEGSYPLDIAALRRAVCALFAAPRPEPAADLPPAEPDEPPQTAVPLPAPAPEPAIVEAAEETAEAEAVPEPVAAPEPAPQPEAEETRGDVKIYRRSKARLYTAMRPAAPDPMPTPDETPGPAAAESEPVAAETDPPAEAGQTAAQALGLDITSPWPGTLESLRRLFATQSPAEGAPDDDFTYVRAPMPAGSGFEACMIGLRANGGRADAVRYALPGTYAPQPPAGLECYAWSERGGRGWWTTTVAPDGGPIQN